MNATSKRTLKIITAPDSFKGSISATELCLAMERGIRRIYPEGEAEVVHLPMADGGEGTVENMVFATGGRYIETEAGDPLGRPVTARYGALGGGRTAVIELAAASGLPLLAKHELDPLGASSRGTGELIRHALDQGFRRLIVGLGGSAVNDGGTGLLRALGVEFLDADGRPLPEGGAALARLARIDATGLDARLAEAEIVMASDVTNPLCGPTGASAVFGPQKGADAQAVALLDAALARYADVIARQFGRDVASLPGAGAAGGTGAALLAFLAARIRSGIEVVMETVGFAEHLRGADLVLTGEGRLDGQTLSGKVVAGVCKLARPSGTPVVALCGSGELGGEAARELGLAAWFSIVPGPVGLEEAMNRAAEWAERQAESVLGVWKAAARSGRPPR